MFGSGESEAARSVRPAADGGCSGPGAARSGGALSTAQLSTWAGALQGLVGDVDDAERIDQLRLLEELKSAAAAAQAVVTAAFARSQRAANGVPVGGDPDDDEPTESADREDSVDGALDADGSDGADSPESGDSADSSDSGDSADSGACAPVGDGRLDGAEGVTAREGSAVAPSAASPTSVASAAEREQRRRRAGQATRSIRSQVALARKESPHCGGRHLGLAEVLVYEMPHTLAALADGTISEWRATLICRETAGLSREHRAMVDAELDGRLSGAGDRQAAQLARTAAYRLDPEAVVKRSSRAASDRRVSIRPAPDTMTYLSGLLPVESGVAVYAELGRAADSAVASGDGRSRGQLMADTLVDRILNPGASTESGAGFTAGCGTGSCPDTESGHEAAGDVAVDPPTTADSDSTAGDAAADGNPVTVATVDGAAADADPVDAGDVDPVAAVRAAFARARAADGPAAASPDTARSTDAGARGARTRETSYGPDPGVGASPPAAVGVPPGVDLEIGLIVTDQALFGGDDEPALLNGEVIPAELARALVADLPARSKAWIRRLYTRPDTGQLAAMDSRHRLFDDNLRRFILLRDQRCRTPWCDAPIRHADHARPAARGGPTSAANGDGLSEDCNYVREAPGWHASTSGTADGDLLTVTTPTGHRYTSSPPALHRPRGDARLPATGS